MVDKITTLSDKNYLACSGFWSSLNELSELFNHASPMVTRRYLGLRREELGEVYEMMRF